MSWGLAALIPLLPLTVGLVLLGFGARTAAREWNFLRRARRVIGTTLPSESTTRVRFRTLDGREVTAATPVYLSYAGSRTPVPRKPGETVTVLYDPEDPSRIRLHGLFGTFFLPSLVFCVFGVGGIGAAFVIWRFMLP
ncbi:DUF3592 domain-containing protein [Allosalinactinospora lopnorensis]|uniref:DUF3592 domain-containing protein n=1 Tax=Allosalinactinospora lopnorensis TaxID=1352348 RepID=UPI0006975C5D|nr:DUF3592 domain-containing protein [Allosalinactinospora lopnorensis]